jgi:hypothetical protein
VSCVKLPAAVAFPTDDRLLQRIEESRRALPADNMKSLRKSRDASSPAGPRERDVATQSMTKVSLGALDLFPMRIEARSPNPEPHPRVVPLARAAGSLARGHDRVSRALHSSAAAS